MNRLLFTILFFFKLSALSAQTERMDLLINNIDNQKLVGTCNYVWVLKNGSYEADTLIKIGRSKTKDLNPLCLKLYNLLTDSTKGIISHYILSNIINAEGVKYSSFYFYDEDGTLEYNYNGLRFYENKYKSMFTDYSELEHNREVWSVILRQMKVLN